MKKKNKILCFDIDNTICKTVGNKYYSSLPIKKNINCINELYKKGYYIIIYTARFMGRTNEKINLVKKLDNGFTKKQLKRWGLKFNRLKFGKPSYDLIIDDKSINFRKNWVDDLKKKL